MNNFELKIIQETVGICNSQVSILCSVSKRTVERWRSGEKDIPNGAASTLFFVLDMFRETRQC